MKIKATKKVVMGVLSVIVIFIIAVIFGTLGALQWRKAAQYPPPIEHPAVRGSITFAGLADEHMGMAMWSGEDDEEIGHTIKTSLGPYQAPYFLSSRDYDDIDPMAACGIKGTEPVNGLLEFMHALTEHDLTLSDMKITLPRFDLAKDVKDEDWIFKKNIETRYLQADAPIRIRLRSEDMIAISVDTLIWIQDFNSASTYWETVITGMTNKVIPEDISHTSSPEVRDLTKLFLESVGNLKVRLVIEKVAFSGSSFSGEGRTKGTFLDIHEARLEIVP